MSESQRLKNFSFQFCYWCPCGCVYARAGSAETYFQSTRTTKREKSFPTFKVPINGNIHSVQVDFEGKRSRSRLTFAWNICMISSWTHKSSHKAPESSPNFSESITSKSQSPVAVPSVKFVTFPLRQNLKLSVSLGQKSFHYEKISSRCFLEKNFLLIMEDGKRICLCWMLMETFHVDADFQLSLDRVMPSARRQVDIAYLLYMRTSGFHSRCGGIRKSLTPPYSEEFQRRFMSFHSWCFAASMRERGKKGGKRKSDKTRVD